MVEIRLLGPPEVWVEGRRLELPTRKLLALLAYLLLEGPTPRARLADMKSFCFLPLSRGS
jgi:DNA-binding SARP family transcriptional activator